MPRCKAPLPAPRLRQAGKITEGGVATNKSRVSRDCHAGELVSRAKAYLKVRRNDEGRGERGR